MSLLSRSNVPAGWVKKEAPKEFGAVGDTATPTSKNDRTIEFYLNSDDRTIES